MLKKLLFLSALFLSTQAQAQTLVQLFQLGANLTYLATMDAAADPTLPAQLTWGPLASNPEREKAEQQAAKKAVAALNKRVMANPDSVSLYVIRGQQFGKIGKGPAALIDFNKAKAKGSTDPLLSLYLAHAALMNNKGEEAHQHLKDQRADFPQNPEADVFEARLWLAKPGILSQNCKQALPALEHAIQLDSTHMTARLLRGYSYYATNRYAQAIQDYLYILRHDPANARVQFYIGKAYLSNSNKEEACRHFAQSTLFAPTQANWYLRKYCR